MKINNLITEKLLFAFVFLPFLYMTLRGCLCYLQFGGGWWLIRFWGCIGY